MLVYKYQLQLSNGTGSVLGHTLIGCVAWYVNQVGCILILVVIGQGRLTWISGNQYSCHACWDRCWASGSRPSGSNPLRRARFIAWHLRNPLLENDNWAPSIFGTTGRMWVTVLHLVPTIKKAMYHNHAYVGRLTNIRFCFKLEPVLFLSAKWALVGTPGQLSAIVVIVILRYSLLKISESFD